MNSEIVNVDNCGVFFFDFDGVILDSVKVKTTAFAKLFEEFGTAISEKVVEYHLENKGVSRYKKFRYYYENLLGMTINDDILENLDQEMRKIVMEEIKNTRYIAGMPDFIQRHYQTKDCFIISATPQKEIENIVRLRHLDNYFAEVKGSPISKNQHIAAIITKYRYKNDECVMFGDAESDLLAAQENSINFVGINLKTAGFNIKDFSVLL